MDWGTRSKDMAILFGSIAGAACIFYVHVLVQFLRESDRETHVRLEPPAAAPFRTPSC